MGSKLFMFLLSRVLLFHVVLANSFSCHDEESSALLQFKQTFIISLSASYYDYAYPKVSSWKPTHKGENNSCCSWNGVECDEKTGHVIGLDLSSSCLHGSINSSSSLFHLVHLQRLNLADNNLNYSQIPNVVRNFPKITYLNLSGSSFSGQIPSEVWHLSKLLILDLSRNHFNGPISASLANLTHLTTFSVCVNQLTGLIPSSLGNLSTLTKIDLSWNELHGSIPESLSNLMNLLTLYLNSNSFSGPIDFNMFHKLQNLAFLDLSSNKLEFLAETRTVNATISRLQFLGLGS